ncbi:hypothetical protein QP157_21160 [Sphingomonas sp. LR61]|uniref:hypothetical protein n=1 Tax=Bacteria TaxID=2 RepID=UPI001416F306|nr:hypothetical protein [Curtobacterium sp. VKM Ac-1393]MBF4609373.1 hypothetical protein [Curtobacterium sp. VKM Ac-1393]
MITYEDAQRLTGSELEAQQRAVVTALRQLSRSVPTYWDDRTDLERARRILARVDRDRRAGC